MVMKVNGGVVEVEVDAPSNNNLLFLPLGRKVRGRFDWRRVKNPLAVMKAAAWPGDQVIPGQRIGVDLESGRAWIAEPLQDSANQAVADKIKAEGWKIAPALEEFPAADLPTWIYWIKRAVEGGLARLIRGTLPDKIDGEPKRAFFSNPKKLDPRDKLISTLVALVADLLPPDKRKQLSDAMR